MTDDYIYLLSMTENHHGDTGSMFIVGPGLPPDDSITRNTLDEVTHDITKAKVFQTEKEAWEYNEYQTASFGWQITPILRKRLFKDKLKG